MDGNSVHKNDVRLLVLALTNDIIKYSQPKADFPSHGARLKIGDLSLTTGLRDLIFEKAQLVSDLLLQQESFQSHLARELHDTVVADLIFVRRSLSVTDRAKLCETLDGTLERLRNICADYSSTELKEWGLWDALYLLTDRLAGRTGDQIELVRNRELPDLPFEVTLQLYRMVQESLNNAIKHSQASKIRITASGENELILTISDDGCGFDPGTLKEIPGKGLGKMGLSLQRERAERLTALCFPTVVQVDSKDGSGTTIQITVDTTNAKLGA